MQLCHTRRVAHRDLKLPNILITEFPSVKVADFGFAAHCVDGRMRTFCGSPAYGAPEPLSMTEYDGERADLWSLGMILCDLVTKRWPWQLTNLVKIVAQIKAYQYTFPPHVSPPCQDLVRRLIALRPCDRLQFDLVFAHAWLRGMTAPAPRPRRAPQLPPRGPSVLQITQALGRDKAQRIVSPFAHAGMARSASRGLPTDPAPKRFAASLDRRGGPPDRVRTRRPH
jgi:serine/threonine protein kinase